MSRELVVHSLARTVNSSFGDEEGPVFCDGEGGGEIAGVEGLVKSVGGISIEVDEAIVVGVDELGDLIAAEGEDAIARCDFD